MMNMQVCNETLPYPLGYTSGVTPVSIPQPTHSGNVDARSNLSLKPILKHGTKRLRSGADIQPRRVKFRIDTAPEVEPRRTAHDMSPCESGLDATADQEEVKSQENGSKGGFRGWMAFLRTGFQAAKADSDDDLPLPIPGAFPEEETGSPSTACESYASNQRFLRRKSMGDTAIALSAVSNVHTSPLPYSLRSPCSPHLPSFLVPVQPPSFPLPGPVFVRGRKDNLSIPHLNSPWHDYYISLDRETEARAIKARRKVGSTAVQQVERIGHTARKSVINPSVNNEKAHRRNSDDCKNKTNDYSKGFTCSSRVLFRKQRLEDRRVRLLPLAREPLSVLPLVEGGRLSEEARRGVEARRTMLEHMKTLRRIVPARADVPESSVASVETANTRGGDTNPLPLHVTEKDLETGVPYSVEVQGKHEISGKDEHRKVSVSGYVEEPSTKRIGLDERMAISSTPHELRCSPPSFGELENFVNFSEQMLEFGNDASTIDAVLPCEQPGLPVAISCQTPEVSHVTNMANPPSSYRQGHEVLTAVSIENPILGSDASITDASIQLTLPTDNVLLQNVAEDVNMQHALVASYQPALSPPAPSNPGLGHSILGRPKTHTSSTTGSSQESPMPTSRLISTQQPPLVFDGNENDCVTCNFYPTFKRWGEGPDPEHLMTGGLPSEDMLAPFMPLPIEQVKSGAARGALWDKRHARLLQGADHIVQQRRSEAKEEKMSSPVPYHDELQRYYSSYWNELERKIVEDEKGLSRRAKES